MNRTGIFTFVITTVFILTVSKETFSEPAIYNNSHATRHSFTTLAQADVQEADVQEADVQEADVQEADVQEADVQEAATVEETAEADAGNDTAAADTTPALGTIIVTSIPDSAGIIINDVNVGITPFHATGFYPGIYEVTIFKSEYESYVKTIDLQPGGTEFVTGGLSPETGRFFVSSVPESATVYINDTLSGLTPYQSKQLLPGNYHLRIEASHHTSYAETLTVMPKLVDTLQVTLTALKKPFLPSFPALKDSRNVRRIAFGTVSIGATVTGILLNLKTIALLDDENDAYIQYSAAQLSEKEYDKHYDTYLEATKTTDRYATLRNIFYTAGIISGAGFCFSIFF